jgi:hypothetical protein
MAWSSSFVSAPPVPPEEENEIILKQRSGLKFVRIGKQQASIWFEYDYKFANADSNNMYQWDNWVVGDRQPK